MGRHSLPDPDEAGGRRSEPPVPRDGSESDSPTDVFGDDEQTSRLATGGGQRSGGWENGEWTGSHRAVTPGPRKVSVGVIVALVSVVVVVAAVILWRFV